MKILLVHNQYQIPGGEEVVFEQEREMLVRAGHQVLTYERSNFEAEDYKGLRKLNLIANIAWSNDSKGSLQQILREEKPDVVHVHNFFMMMSPSIFAACHEAGVPVVQTLHNYRMFCPAANFLREGKVCEDCAQQSLWHGIGHGCYRGSRLATASVALMLEFQRQRRAWADLYIALSDFSRQRFIANGLDARKLCVKPNFVSPDPGERTEQGSYALYLGRLSEEKGLETLLDGWRRLRCDIALRVVGDGPLLESLKNRANDLKLSCVKFVGRVPRAQAQQEIKGARFVMAPSQCYENFPMGIAEAFACGVPVICSKLGGMQEMVAHGTAGLNFTPGDPADLANKVQWAWSHPEEMQAMGKQARREFENKYTAERNYPLLMEIYRRAIAMQPARSAAADPATADLTLSHS
jgi:glycosyltransferase involved in cell wall biosynthesis